MPGHVAEAPAIAHQSGFHQLHAAASLGGSAGVGADRPGPGRSGRCWLTNPKNGGTLKKTWDTLYDTKYIYIIPHSKMERP